MSVKYGCAPGCTQVAAAKVILSVILPRFTFEKSEKPVVWNLGGVRYPAVGKYGGKACLPMKVSLYKGGRD